MYHFIRFALLLYVGLKGNASLFSAFSWEYKGNPGVDVEEECEDIDFTWLCLLFIIPQSIDTVLFGMTFLSAVEAVQLKGRVERVLLRFSMSV